MQLELQIISPKSDSEFLQHIVFNDKELAAQLSEALTKYTGVVYTEDTVKDAKEDRAKLNKLKDAIETRRKEIKKQCLKPYEEFEAKIKYIVSMIESPMLAIDGQIKSFEEKKRADKYAMLKDIFDGLVEELGTLVSFDKIFRKEWLNVTFSATAALNEIDSILARIRSDLEAIAALNSEDETDLKAIYFRTLDLGEALRENERRNQERKAIEQQALRQAELKAQAEAQKAAAPVVPAPTPAPVPVQVAPAPAPVADEPLIEMAFKLWATREQLNLLKTFFQQNNIKYGRI